MPACIHDKSVEEGCLHNPLVLITQQEYQSLTFCLGSVQTFISCGKEGTGDACRKPAPGMWHLMEKHLNDGIPIDKERC